MLAETRSSTTVFIYKACRNTFQYYRILHSLQKHVPVLPYTTKLAQSRSSTVCGWLAGGRIFRLSVAGWLADFGLLTAAGWLAGGFRLSVAGWLAGGFFGCLWLAGWRIVGYACLGLAGWRIFPLSVAAGWLADFGLLTAAGWLADSACLWLAGWRIFRLSVADWLADCGLRLSGAGWLADFSAVCGGWLADSSAVCGWLAGGFWATDRGWLAGGFRLFVAGWLVDFSAVCGWLAGGFFGCLWLADFKITHRIAPPLQN